MNSPTSLTPNHVPAPKFRLSDSTHLATVLRIVLLLLVNTALLVVIAMPIAKWVNPPGPATPWFAWTLMFAWQPIMAIQGLVWQRYIDRRPISDMQFGFSGRHLRLALLALLVVVVMFAAYIALTEWTGVTHWHWNAAFIPNVVLLTALVTALAGFGEEILFRGYLLNTLRRYSPLTAALVSSLIFGSVHMLTGRIDPLDQLALFLHGFAFATIAQRTRSLWPGLIIHFVYNGLTCLIWTGDANSALLMFDSPLGWTKWAFKALMVVPLLLVAYSWRATEKQGSY